MPPWDHLPGAGGEGVALEETQCHSELPRVWRITLEEPGKPGISSKKQYSLSYLKVNGQKFELALFFRLREE